MAGFKWDGRQTIYWRQGIAVTQGGNKGFFIVEPYYFHPDGSMGISISIESYFGDFSPMGFIVDQIEMLIQEWYPGMFIIRVIEMLIQMEWFILKCLSYDLHNN